MNGQGRIEKYWKELSVEEKIERTRKVLKQKTFEMESLAEIIYRFKVQFENHSHQDSKIVTPINQGIESGYLLPGDRSRGLTDKMPENPDEVYF